MLQNNTYQYTHLKITIKRPNGDEVHISSADYILYMLISLIFENPSIKNDPHSKNEATSLLETPSSTLVIRNKKLITSLLFALESLKMQKYTLKDIEKQTFRKIVVWLSPFLTIYLLKDTNSQEDGVNLDGYTITFFLKKTKNF